MDGIVDKKIGWHCNMAKTKVWTIWHHIVLLASSGLPLLSSLSSLRTSEECKKFAKSNLSSQIQRSQFSHQMTSFSMSSDIYYKLKENQKDFSMFYVIQFYKYDFKQKHTSECSMANKHTTFARSWVLDFTLQSLIKHNFIFFCQES